MKIKLNYKYIIQALIFRKQGIEKLIEYFESNLQCTDTRILSDQ
jgi:hypothetical protein